MPPIKCPFPECMYTTDDVEVVLAAAQLNIHALVHSSQTQSSGSRQQPPKIVRPTLARGTSEEDWNTFAKKWELFKSGTNITDSQLTIQLWQCCDQELEADLFRDVPDIASKNEKMLLQSIKRLSVITVAASVRRTELLALRQDHGQTIRSFAAKVKGKAQICAFSKNCTKTSCNQLVDYTEDIVKYVVISGIVDEDIKKDILSYPDLDNKSLNETISLIENKEMATRAMNVSIGETSTLASNSTYKHSKYIQEKLAVKTKCVTCDKKIQRFKLYRGRGGKGRSTLKEFTSCIDCWRKANNTKEKSTRPSQSDNTSSDTAGALFDLLSPIIMSTSDESKDDVATIATSRQSIVLDHQLFDGTNGWRTGESKKQPSLKLKLSTNQCDYDHINLKSPKVSSTVEAITDTGAQSSLMGLKMFLRCGFRVKYMIPVKRKMYAANNEGINVLGAILVRLSGKDEKGRCIEAAEMIYISDSTDLFYLSRHAMEQLKIIGPDFPKIGAAIQATIDCTSEQLTEVNNDCKCLPRSKPPGRPSTLPFKPIDENVDKMKEWLLKRFAASTFNKCTHQTLPMMTGPPIKLHIDREATPTAIHTPSPIPVHWVDEVKEQLDTDVRLGVIEKVEPNTPTTWCHRALWTRKADGRPRRVIDLQPLNQHCIRETHHTVPPFQQARIIPNYTYRTVTDAWNGYHSVPVCEEDRHLLTFLKEFGRFRYCVAPQDYLASGDGYTHRYDRIIADIPRKTKCVDDAVLWNDTMEDHWWRIIDYLELMGNEGIILNPQKFQFCEKKIDIAGFRITENEVRPLPKYLESIKSFPRPTKIADIRAWFGLVNQVAHYNKLIDMMAPFKPLLSPKTAFRWDDQLETAFVKSKCEHIEAIKHGVQIFDPRRTTCLTP